MKHETTETDVRSVLAFWKRALCMLLVLLSLVGVLPVDILAADIWDGTGGGGDGNGSTITGGFWLESTGAYDSLFGFRFTVYDAGGNRVGTQGIEIDIRTLSKDVYRFDGKKSHMDLYDEYQLYAGGRGDAPTLGATVKTVSTSESGGYYLDTSLSYLRDTGPSNIGEWLSADNSEKAAWVAQKCDVNDYGPLSHFIIVEPMFIVALNDVLFTMTMAELAVFQATQVEAARKAYNAANPGTYEKEDGWNSFVDGTDTLANEIILR